MSDELLPLPSPDVVNWPGEGWKDEPNVIALWDAHGYDTGAEPYYSADKVRGIVEAATAELRAEVDALKDRCEMLHGSATVAQRRAETLAEALRAIYNHHNSETMAQARAALARCKGGSGDER